MSVNDFRKPITTELFEVKEGPSDFSTTFVLGNEDHTLGNSLRHILMQRRETEFCGYSVPHPYEPKMNIRLQTQEKSAREVFIIGLKEMEEMCDILDNVFDSAIEEYLES
mmetsp:Transcript_12465/g.12549  ORF Transcript_12465/g.12549 Transcript_12465/m.12549 type:complete len:110 (+) Transcript_12465:14-343(+)